MKTMESKKTKRTPGRFRRFLRTSEAVSALEYAILVGVIATVIAAAVVTFGGKVEEAIVKVQKEVTEAAGEVGD